jgi:hypothetical protein
MENPPIVMVKQLNLLTFFENFENVEGIRYFVYEGRLYIDGADGEHGLLGDIIPHQRVDVDGAEAFVSDYVMYFAHEGDFEGFSLRESLWDETLVRSGVEVVTDEDRARVTMRA